jgi:hypothetical protein
MPDKVYKLLGISIQIKGPDHYYPHSIPGIQHLAPQLPATSSQ